MLDTHQHRLYHYSVTFQTSDLALLGCLRALAQYAQTTGNPRIPWGGTKYEDWKQAGQQATFRFTSAAYRSSFIAQVERLLPGGLWNITGQRDDDPATRQTAI